MKTCSDNLTFRFLCFCNWFQEDGENVSFKFQFGLFMQSKNKFSQRRGSSRLDFLYKMLINPGMNITDKDCCFT